MRAGADPGTRRCGFSAGTVRCGGSDAIKVGGREPDTTRVQRKAYKATLDDESSPSYRRECEAVRGDDDVLYLE